MSCLSTASTGLRNLQGLRIIVVAMYRVDWVNIPIPFLGCGAPFLPIHSVLGFSHDDPPCFKVVPGGPVGREVQSYNSLLSRIFGGP